MGISEKDVLKSVLKVPQIEEQLENIQNELEEVFQSVSNGKTLIASAITDKGVTTSNDVTFKQMADNIRLIEGGTGGGIEVGETPIYKGEYRLVFSDDFTSPYLLNKDKWDDGYLKTWTAEQSDQQKTHYNLKSGSIELYTDSTMKPWCPEYDGANIVSALQTGNRTQLHKFGGVGSGNYITDVPLYLSNIEKYGKFELKAKFKLDQSSTNHIAWWMTGFQDREFERGELDIFEIYPTQYDIVMHPNGDPNVTYSHLPLGKGGVDLVNDGNFHIYTVIWDETGFEFFIDGASKGKINKNFAYPMITYFSMYEKRSSGINTQTFEIEYFRVYKKVEESKKVSRLEVISQEIETINLSPSSDNYTELGGVKNISSYVKLTWNDGTITHQPVVWDKPTSSEQIKIKHGGNVVLYGDIKGVPFSVLKKRAEININTTSTSGSLLIWLESSDLRNGSTSWIDKSGNGNNFTLEPTSIVNDKGLLMTSAKCSCASNITLSNVFTVDYTFTISKYLTVDGHQDDYSPFYSLNANNISSYCDNIASYDGNTSELKINGYSGNTHTTLKINTRDLNAVHNIRLVYGVNEVKVYYNGQLHSTYARGSFNASGMYKVVLGAGSWEGFPISQACYYLKNFKLYNTESVL